MPGVFVVLVVCLLFSLASCGRKQTQLAKPQPGANAVPNGQDSLTIELVGRDSVTVLDLLKATHQAKVISTAEGSFVTGIDSLNANSNLFWIYSVNGTSPDVACDRFFTHHGDRVVWHLRKM